MDATQGLAQVNTLATQYAFTVWNGASDFLIILILFGALFLFSWYYNYGQLVAIQLAFYAAYALYVVFPYTSFLPSAPATTSLWAHIGLYAAFSLVLYIILRRVIVSDFLYVSLIGVVALSFLGAAFLLALAYHTFGVTEVYRFTPAVDLLFAAKSYFWWWFVAPAIGLFFLAR